MLFTSVSTLAFLSFTSAAVIVGRQVIVPLTAVDPVDGPAATLIEPTMPSVDMLSMILSPTETSSGDIAAPTEVPVESIEPTDPLAEVIPEEGDTPDEEVAPISEV